MAPNRPGRYGVIIPNVTGGTLRPSRADAGSHGRPASVVPDGRPTHP